MRWKLSQGGFYARKFYARRDFPRNRSNDRQGHRCEAILVDSKQSVFRRAEANDRAGRPAVATVKARLYRNKNILTCARRQCTRVTSTRLFASTVVRSVHLERVVLALAFALLAVRRTRVGCAFRKSVESQSPSRLRNVLSSLRRACHHRLLSFCPTPRFSSRRDAIPHYRIRTYASSRNIVKSGCRCRASEHI